MSINCPVCSKENPDTQEFCALCGTLLRGSAEPPKELSPEDLDAMLAQRIEPVETPLVSTDAAPAQPTPAEPIETRRLEQRTGDDEVVEKESPVNPFAAKTSAPSLPPPKPTSRRFSPRCLGIGCLGALILLLALAVVYLYALRPLIQNSFIKQMERLAGESFMVASYSGPVQTVSVSQQKASTIAQPYWAKIRWLKDGELIFQQDELIVRGRWLFFPLEARLDLRVDGGGNLLVQSTKTNWVTRLFFTHSGLSDALTSYVNEDILRPKNLSLRALQFTNGKLFLAYGER